jgi:hypothetical protein
MMTQKDLEQVATQMRARGLHSSWNELLELSEFVVGNLVDAYQVLLRNSASSGGMLLANPGDLRVLVREKLGRALVSLTSKEQVARWESEALASDILPCPEEKLKPRALEKE